MEHSHFRDKKQQPSETADRIQVLIRVRPFSSKGKLLIQSKCLQLSSLTSKRDVKQ